MDPEPLGRCAAGLGDAEVGRLDVGPPELGTRGPGGEGGRLGCLGPPPPWWCVGGTVDGGFVEGGGCEGDGCDDSGRVGDTPGGFAESAL